MIKFSTFSAAFVFLFIFSTSISFAEEKTMWEKFVGFFSPSPTLEGDGPLYDELHALDNKISRTEGKYSRERRPGNKARIRKELDKLNAEREKLVVRIREEEKKKSTASSTSRAVSSNPSSVLVSTAANQASCEHDTVFIHDTTIVKDTVYDTLYVIVADKPAKENSKDSIQESNNK